MSMYGKRKIIAERLDNKDYINLASGFIAACAAFVLDKKKLTGLDYSQVRIFQECRVILLSMAKWSFVNICKSIFFIYAYKEIRHNYELRVGKLIMKYEDSIGKLNLF